MHKVFYILFAVLLLSCGADPLKKTSKIKSLEIVVSYFSDTLKLKEFVKERKEYDSSGNIVFSCEYSENGKVESMNRYTYDKRGRELEDIDYLNDTVRFISVTTYTSFDSVDLYIIYTRDRKIDFTIKALYNEEKQNFMDIATKPDGRIYFSDIYTLNAEGKQLKWERYDEDSTLESTVTYEYNENGKQIKNRCSGNFGGTYEYKYDALGRKTEETACNTEDSTFLWLKSFDYDSLGKLAKITEYNSKDAFPKKPFKIYSYLYK